MSTDSTYTDAQERGIRITGYRKPAEDIASEMIARQFDEELAARHQAHLRDSRRHQPTQTP